CAFAPGMAKPWLPNGGVALCVSSFDWAIAGVKASSIKADETNGRRMVGSFVGCVAYAGAMACPASWERWHPARIDKRSARIAERKSGGDDPLPGLSKRKHVSDEIILFLLVQLEAEDQVEELNGVGKRQQPPIMHVGRRVLDAAQSECLDRPVRQH